MVCKYKCQKCGNRFERDKPGPVTCEKCGHPYIDWLNYKEVLKQKQGAGAESVN